MRRAAKRDASEPAIVAALEAVGATVQRLSDRDAPDLLVGYRGLNVALECKAEGGRLSRGQAAWIRRWAGAVFVVKSPAEAIEAITRLAPAVTTVWEDGWKESPIPEEIP